MDKSGGPNQGVRPESTLSYDIQKSQMDLFLNPDLSKFMEFPFLLFSCEIFRVRNTLKTNKVEFQSNMFESSDTTDALKSFQHFLDVFEFSQTGAGSWSEAMDRLAAFRRVGLSFTGNARANHLTNVEKAFKTLLRDLHQCLLHFTYGAEAVDVTKTRSGRVYEAGGDYCKYLTDAEKRTADMNSLVNLLPSLSAAMASSSSHGGGDDGDADKDGGGSPSGGKFPKKKQEPKIAKGSIILGTATYAIAPCMTKVKEAKPDATRGNFCLVYFLSTKGQCLDRSHKKGCKQHTFDDAVKAIRPSLECKPCRTDSNAKPKE